MYSVSDKQILESKRRTENIVMFTLIYELSHTWAICKERLRDWNQNIPLKLITKSKKFKVSNSAAAVNLKPWITSSYFVIEFVILQDFVSIFYNWTKFHIKKSQCYCSKENLPNILNCPLVKFQSSKEHWLDQLMMKWSLLNQPPYWSIWLTNCQMINGTQKIQRKESK